MSQLNIDLLFQDWLQRNPGPHYIVSDGAKVLVKPRDYYDTTEMKESDDFFSRTYSIYLDDEQIFIDPEVLCKHMDTPLTYQI